MISILPVNNYDVQQYVERIGARKVQQMNTVTQINKISKVGPVTQGEPFSNTSLYQNTGGKEGEVEKGKWIDISI